MNNTKYPHRQIRSFVRRQGRMSITQHQALTTFESEYGLATDQGMLELDKVFGRSARRILEIGFGMGQSLLIQAQQNPDQDYLGIEVHKPGVGNLLVALQTHGITNVRIFCADAIDILERCIPDNSLTTVQLFFPDPWPKRRHRKRRLVQPAFLALIQRKLQNDGCLHMATDWQDYAEQMLKMLSETKGFINTASDQQFSPRPSERPLTKFEKRGQQLGHGIWDLVFRKV